MIPVRRSSIFRLGQRSWGQISQLKAAWHSLSYSTEACTGSATHSAQPNPASRSGNVFDTEKVLDFDPYNYTGARWLVNDNLQRRLRYINFDFNELSEKVLALSDAKSITNCEKIEGSNHRVFTFTLDNGNRTIARLPFKVAGPPSLTTASEVATIRYLQQKTKIPVPKILDWSDDASYNIGSEYIISEHAPGTNLHWKWPDMTDDQRVKCIKNIYQILKEVVTMDFPMYGSIYFANTLTHPTHALDDEFCIGPHCGERYWECGTTKFYHHHGSPTTRPLPDMLAYTNAQINTGLALLPPRTPDPDLTPQPTYQGSITQHIKLLEAARDVLHAISQDPQLKPQSTPTLLPDVQKRNILVSDSDPSVVTAILDWNGAAIEPAFRYASPTPDFAYRASGRPVPNGAVPKKRLNLEEDDAERGSNELCAEAFRDAIRDIPRLNEPRGMHENIFRLYWVCADTWSRGIPSLHHELVELRKDWRGLGFNGTCPYPEPSGEEIRVHEKEYEEMKTAAELKVLLCDTLNVELDGWLIEENWDAVQEVHKELYGKALNEIVNAEPEEGEERVGEREVRAMWPFDVPV